MDEASRRWVEGTLAVATLTVVMAWAVSLLAISRRATSSVTSAEVSVDYSFSAGALAWVVAASALTGGVTALLQRSADRRSAKRYKCRLGFRLELYGTLFTASLRDISEKGAQVKIRGFSLSPGEPVTLRIGEIRQRGAVVWSREEKAGIQFSEEMPYDAFRFVLNRARKRGSLFKDEEPES